MREFFRGWRRKTGVVALVMALAVMGLWARSLMVIQSPNLFGYPERIQFGDNRFVSFNGTFEWYGAGHTQTRVIPAWNGEFTTIVMTEEQHPLFEVWYCVIAIPLTLLSVYLILWKPRKRKAESDA